MKKFFKKIYYKIRKNLEIYLSGQACFTLAKVEWENIEIMENNEQLVELHETEKLKLSIINKQYMASVFVRKTVADMLYTVSKNLPDNICLVVIEGFRSYEHQKKLWDFKQNTVKLENPYWTDEEIEREVRKIVAKPSHDQQNPSNHICGGAVDVTLCTDTGELLDMGANYPTVPEDLELIKKFPMYANGLSAEQKHNRKILRDAMTDAGFVYYPGEWWHYCYNDRMWATYTGRKQCGYGMVDEAF